MPWKSTPLEQRFWSKVDRRGSSDCWPWIGNKNWKGYGRISVGRVGRPATRVSWELANGRSFPEGMIACHTCDNPGCVNPAHIWPGTHSDNIRDSVSKGRWPLLGRQLVAGGSCAHGHRLTPENTITGRSGYLRCRACVRDKERAKYRELAAANRGGAK
jgi:hypothetical protein